MSSKSPEEQRRLKEPRPEDLTDPVVQRFLAAEPQRKPLLKGPKVLARRGHKQIKRASIPVRKSGGLDWREQNEIRKIVGRADVRVGRTWRLRKTRPYPCKVCGQPMIGEQEVARLIPSGDTVHLACAPTTHLRRQP